MIAPWLRPMLWGERDWGQALGRVAQALGRGGDQAARAAELGRALEHVVPDRRRAIAVYAGGGPAELARARTLAVELAWWPAVARLALAERLAGGAASLAVDELVAWLDAGEPMLAAIVAVEARAAAPGDPYLAAIDGVLRGGDDPGATAARLEAQAPHDPRALATAARLARLGGDRPGAQALLARAVALAPSEPGLAALALASIDDEAAVQALVRTRLRDREPAAWVETARGLGLALVDRPGLRGLGLRLVRAALTLAYEHGLGAPPGHLAMWTLLAEHAAASATRPTLLALAAIGLERELPIDDRVWLAALGADIAWDDAGDLEVAQAWAAVVREHAPEHPSVRAIDAASVAEVFDDGLVYLDRAYEPEATRSRSRSIDATLSALRTAVARADDPVVSIDVALDDLHESAPAPAEAVAVLTAAVDATARALTIAHAAAVPPVAPAASPTSTGPSATAAAAAAAATAASPSSTKTAPAPAAAATASAPAVKAATAPAPPTSATASAPAVKAATAPAPPTSATASAPAPARSLIPSSARSALGKMPSRLPALPPLPPRPGARPRAHRVAVPLDAVLERPGQPPLPVVCRDISVSGVFVLTDAALTIGDALVLVVHTPTDEAWTEHRHQTDARVVRREPHGYGLELVSPPAELLAELARLDA
ncbi:MAG: PilZ domain-containing protein [Myxococcales bacterium]|nr:PilZ domain-containing protein [Myxococcales bacterium]